MIQSLILCLTLIDPPFNHSYSLKTKPVQREVEVAHPQRHSKQRLNRTYDFIDQMREGNPKTDLNKDGRINGTDLELFLNRMDQRRVDGRTSRCCRCFRRA